MLRLADEGEPLTVVDDQIGAPTSATWVADATAAVLRRLDEGKIPDADGLYHLAASGQTSWYGFAKAIFAQFERPDVVVEPIASDEYPTAAERPAYTVLDSGKARTTFDLAIPTWRFRRGANSWTRCDGGWTASGGRFSGLCVGLRWGDTGTSEIVHNPQNGDRTIRSRYFAHRPAARPATLTSGGE